MLVCVRVDIGEVEQCMYQCSKVRLIQKVFVSKDDFNDNAINPLGDYKEYYEDAWFLVFYPIESEYCILFPYKDYSIADRALHDYSRMENPLGIGKFCYIRKDKLCEKLKEKSFLM